MIAFTADDFGLSPAVNEGIERAYRDGVLTHASLMVTGGAVDDAVQRARRLPGLRVGLHLVVIEGFSAITGKWFGSDQFRLGLRHAWHRRALEAEVRAQFAAFAATGLPLSHADAHKHMHMHPMVGATLVRVGREFGLRRVRVPAEPPRIMAALGIAPTLGSRALYVGTRLLRRQVETAGMAAPDAVFGLAWSGHMTERRLLALLPALPTGDVEIYFHPATHADATVTRLMPDYEHAAELAALVSPAVRALAWTGGPGDVSPAVPESVPEDEPGAVPAASARTAGSPPACSRG